MDTDPEIALEDRPQAAGVARMVDGGALAGVAHLADAQSMAAGEVSIIGLDAIAAKMAGRWPVRRGLVYEHTERTLQRRLDGRGFCQRLSDADFVVVLPGAGRARCQSLCLSALREILHHFLGEATLADVVIHEVSRIDGDTLYGMPLEPSLIADEAQAIDAAPAPPAAEETVWSPFVAADGRKVRVSCTLEPLYHLRNSQRIGYRIARRVLEVRTERALSLAEERNLVTSDVERVDFATISRALSRLESDGSRQLTLVLPVSYTTLSSRRSRATLIGYLERAQQAVRHGIICEVRDIEGVPPSGLAAACGVIRPYCLFVFGHLETAPRTNLRNLQDAGLHGLSIDCPTFDGDASFMGWARSLQVNTRAVAKSLIAYRLSSLRQAAIAGLLGVTHGTLTGAPA